MPATTLHPATVPEWDAEEMLTGRLGEEVWPADEDEARAMLNAVRVDLPDEPQQTNLVAFAGERATPLDEALRADAQTYDFYLMGMPIPILVPDDRRLVRLRLRLSLEGDQTLAWDVFPRTEWVAEEHEPGKVSIDVGKALVFVAPPLGDVLGLKLDLPLRYTSHDARVQSTGPNSNPVEWLAKAAALREGFTPYLILRAAKRAPVMVRAQLACELRRRGPLGLLRATYASDEERYTIASP